MPRRNEITGPVEDLAARVWWVHENLPSDSYIGKLSFMAFFDREFYESDRVQCLSPAGEAAYIRACVKAFHFDVPGSLPESALKAIFRRYNLGEDDQETILEAFEEVEGTGNVRWNRGALKSWIFAILPIINGRSGKGSSESRENHRLAAQILEGVAMPSARGHEGVSKGSEAQGVKKGSVRGRQGVAKGSARGQEGASNNPESGIRKPKKEEEKDTRMRTRAREEQEPCQSAPFSLNLSKDNFEEFVERVEKGFEKYMDGGVVDWKKKPKFLQGDLKRAFTVWKRLDKAGELLSVDEMLETVKAWAKSEQWQDLTYIPYLENYLDRRKFLETPP